MFISSPKVHNRSFHVVEGTRTTARSTEMENALTKRAKLLCAKKDYCLSLLNMQIYDDLVLVGVAQASLLPTTSFLPALRVTDNQANKIELVLFLGSKALSLEALTSLPQPVKFEL